MSERFVVDFRIAAAERESLFTPIWRWPVPQPEYDNPLREFVQWAQLLPGKLAPDEDLRTAFELVELDLLKDVAAIVGVFIDVSAARQQGLDVVFGEDQRLYAMIDQDQFENYSPTADKQMAYELSLNTRTRKVRRYVKSRLSRLTALITGQPRVHSISSNTLLREMTSGRSNLIRLEYTDIAKNRSDQERIHPEIADIAHEFSTNIIGRVNDAGHETTDNFNQFVGNGVLNHLQNGWQDRNFLPGFTPTSSMSLFSATGGNYLTRLVSNSFQKHGAKVIRTMHGGDAPLFSDPLWPSTDLPLTNTYVTYGVSSANVVESLAKRQATERGRTQPAVVLAAGSDYHANILKNSSTSQGVNSVYVVASSFMGERRAIPNVCLHDVVYYEWHRRLLEMVRSAGFTAISKRHPKGLGPGIEMYGDVASSELRQVGMADTFQPADAYVIDIAGSAFMEAMCSLKPVVLVDIPVRRMTEAARSAIQKSAQIVVAQFDDRNRVLVDNQQLIEAIAIPVDIDARKQFVHDYLLSSSGDLSDLTSLTV